MCGNQTWNDESRKKLCEQLTSRILGELRLAKSRDADILQNCFEIYIRDDCPEREVDTLSQFAANELERIKAELEAEKENWPDETDCDRLDRVEVALRDRGIMLWQASPCCDSCTGGELMDRLDVVDGRHPGFKTRCRGYTFFIDQRLPEYLAESTELQLYLAYGWFTPDDSDVLPEIYIEKALKIAREVCECLRDEGFEAGWDGDFSRKIEISVNWRRRELLE
jgi:hypothetical protein